MIKLRFASALISLAQQRIARCFSKHVTIQLESQHFVLPPSRELGEKNSFNF